jgi:hypothetical protein
VFLKNNGVIQYKLESAGATSTVLKAAGNCLIKFSSPEAFRNSLKWQLAA